MKTVLLMRHAKSSWKHEDLKDVDRPLNKRGKKDAPYMGELLAKKKKTPELILSSSAKRARQTAKAVAKECKYDGEIQYFDSLYLAEPEAYIDALKKLPDELNRVMIVGHNPGLESLLQQLSGRVETLSTGAIAFIDLPIKNWKELKNEVEGTLMALRYPESSKKKDKK
jgi:phosphohistidine phosphatase